MTLRNGVIAAVAAVVTAALVTTVPALGATAFTISGTRILHDPPYPEQLVPGEFAGYGVEHIKYPASVFGMDRGIWEAAGAVAAGVDRFVGVDDEGNPITEKIIVAGFSQGAIVIAYEKKRLMKLDEDQRPTVDQLKFVTIGDPTGPNGILRWIPFRIPIIGLTPVRPPDTPYDTTIINGEYDGWADFPDRPWNLIATANALLGIIYVHGRYEDKVDGWDLSTVPEKNIVETVNKAGGKTTSYLIPTEKLPLLQPLRDLGFPESFVAALEAPLRKIIDAAYKRNDPGRVTVTTTEETVVEDESEITPTAVDEIETPSADGDIDETAVQSTTQRKTVVNTAVDKTAKVAETAEVTDNVDEVTTQEEEPANEEVAKDDDVTHEDEVIKDDEATKEDKKADDATATKDVADPARTDRAVKQDDTDKTAPTAEKVEEAEKADKVEKTKPNVRKAKRPQFNLFKPKKTRVTVPKAEPTTKAKPATKPDNDNDDTSGTTDKAAEKDAA